MATKKDKTPSKVTVRELKTFIEAVEFVSEDANWYPNAKQWDRIRSMIDKLDDAEQMQTQPMQPITYAAPPMSLSHPMNAIDARPPTAPVPLSELNPTTKPLTDGGGYERTFA